MDHLELAFRELRDQWFLTRLASHSPEREWEDEDQEEIRLRWNRERKEKFDKDTDAIVAGEHIIVAPFCAADLGKKRVV